MKRPEFDRNFAPLKVENNITNHIFTVLIYTHKG